MLQQTFPGKSAFQYSKAGKQLTSFELLQNLCKLMEALPCPTESEILANLKLLVGIRISHRFEDENSDLTWYEGLVVGKIPDSELFEVIYLVKRKFMSLNYYRISTTATLSYYTSRRFQNWNF